MAAFVHRRNKDGSFDSICPQCLLTIATCQTEDALAKIESAHTCDPVDLIIPEIKKSPQSVITKALRRKA